MAAWRLSLSVLNPLFLRGGKSTAIEAGGQRSAGTLQKLFEAGAGDRVKGIKNKRAGCLVVIDPDGMV